MLKKSVTYLIILSVASVILTACGSSKSTRATGKYTPQELSWPTESETNALAPQSQALLSAAHTWLGVPYKYGGNDRKGVDCSGLVVQVYKDALGIPLPRTSREQRDHCTSIAKGSLIPGDLIFFATGKKSDQVSHVGIFIGDNLMIHASSSKGVILSDINSSYYSRTYAGSGLVDQYHSMIGDRKRKSKKGVKPQKPTRSQEGPVIHIPQTEETAGFTLTPVENLPSKADSTNTTADAETTLQPETPDSVAVTATTAASTAASTATAATPVKTATAANTTATATSKTSTTATTTTAAPVKVATVSSTPQEEPTPEEARTAVLNAIKEKEL